MFNPSFLPLKARVIPVEENRHTAWRRVSHGSTHYSADPSLHQPQDGAEPIAARVATIPAKHAASLPMEPEDARLTGDTRSLYRRLLGLNVMNVDRVAGPTDAAAAFDRKPQIRVLRPTSLTRQVA